MTEKITLQEAEIRFAKSIYNDIWPLLEKPDRSPSEDEDLVLNAFASLYHWKRVGTEIHRQRGYWMVSKVYQVLGNPDLALEWAEKCAEVTREFPTAMKDFDLAYAEEALARSYALAGDQSLAEKHYQQAAELGARIKDPEDQKIFRGDFESGDWFGISN